MIEQLISYIGTVENHGNHYFCQMP